MKQLITLFICLSSCCAVAQQATQLQHTKHQAAFDYAYQQNPNIPKGVLEAVAWTMTRMRHITANEPESCLGLPRVYGIMGLTLDGKGYFRNNLNKIALLSGTPAVDIIKKPNQNIMAYAKAYSQLLSQQNITSSQIEDHLEVLIELSELPFNYNLQQNFALNTHLYQILSFLNNAAKQTQFNFPNYQIDLKQVFGAQNLAILSSPKISISASQITNKSGASFSPILPNPMSPDYPPALWDPAPSCNFSSRNGTPISAITIHTIQGTYAGAISWAKNCASNVSYHYVIRSSDGQVTQLVYENDKGWHVGSENPYTIGYEHDGYVSDPAWYTMELFSASAGISKDIINSGYGINGLRTYWGPSCSGGSSSCQLGSCIKIKGHQHYPNQTHTDPGVYWDWPLYYNLINDNPTPISQNAVAGTFTDSGGNTGNYLDDERTLWLIEPAGATSVTLTFSSFDIELNWDYLLVYDGDSTNSPLIGQYTGSTSPGVITSTGGALLIEFRSDCATTGPGWEASWTSIISAVANDSIAPLTSINTPGNWVTSDFPISFNDSDNVGVEQQFYQTLNFDGLEWRSNNANGFFNDNFNSTLHSDWAISTGNWAINAGYLHQSDETVSQTNINTPIVQNNSTSFLYHWAANMQSGSSSNKRQGLHFFSDDATLPNGGNSYFVYFREDGNKCQIYEVIADSWTLKTNDTISINADTWYDYKVIYNPSSGSIKAYINNQLASNWIDPTPLTQGNSVFLRTGNANTLFDDVRVYKSRTSYELITVGPANDFGYLNPNSTTPAGRIHSIVIDSAQNFSSLGLMNTNVDWTPPDPTTLVNDGAGIDIDTTYLSSELSANWQATIDTNSDISRYWYCVGTAAGDSNVVGWTDNWFNTQTTDTGLTLTTGSTYYYTVKAENGAGLFSQSTSSNGQYLAPALPPPTASFSNSITTICDGESIHFTNTSIDGIAYSWVFENGNPPYSTSTNPSVLYDSSGAYSVTLIAFGPSSTTDTTVQIINVNVLQAPSPSFSSSDSLLYLPNATASFTNNSTHCTSYIWNFGDGNQSTIAQPQHTYTDTGFYTLSLIGQNGVCPDHSVTTSNFILVLDSSSAPINVNYLTENNFILKAYPNPTKAGVFLNFNKVYTAIKVEVYTVLGQILSTQEFNSVKIINLELPEEKGVYSVKLNNFQQTPHFIQVIKQ